MCIVLPPRETRPVVVLRSALIGSRSLGDELGREAVGGGKTVDLAIPLEDDAFISAAQARGGRYSVSSTEFRSNADRLITLSTSAVAVCWCNDSPRSSVRSRSSLSRRVFSIAITAWLAKDEISAICLLSNGRASAWRSRQSHRPPCLPRASV